MKHDDIQAYVIADVLDERDRQDRKWGDQRSHSYERWLTIITEEVGETAEAILDKNETDIRKELIQVAASAVAALEMGEMS